LARRVEAGVASMAGADWVSSEEVLETGAALSKAAYRRGVSMGSVFSRARGRALQEAAQQRGDGLIDRERLLQEELL
jgi:hypothetical protein